MTDWIVCYRDILPEEREPPTFSTALLLFLMRALRPGFRHCSVFSEGNGSILVDPLSTILDVRPFPGYLYGSMTYQHCRREVRLTWRPAGLLTCVTVIKHILGIRAWWVQTPWQLYQYIDARKD